MANSPENDENDGEKRSTLQIVISPELRTRFKTLCAREGKLYADMLVILMDSYERANNAQ